MNAGIKVSQFLDMSHMKAMCDKLEAELEKVEAGDAEAIKEVLLNLGDVEDACMMLAGTIRKFVHLRLFPELSLGREQADEPAHARIPPPPSWKKKAPTIEAAIKASRADELTEELIDDCVNNIDIERHLLPMLDDRGVKTTFEELQGGFMEFSIAGKEFLLARKTMVKRVKSLWRKIIRHLVKVLNDVH